MERKNPKQLWLNEAIGVEAEKVHRIYNAAFETNMTFRAFGNAVMAEGLRSMLKGVAAVNKGKPRKRRKING